MPHTPKQRRNSFFNLYFTATISIALVLLTVGFTAFLIVFSRQISRQMRENLAVSVILNDSITPENLARIDKYLAAVDFVKSYEYISKEQALQEHVAALGEDPTEFLGYNPLQASMEVKVKYEYATSDSLARIEQRIGGFEGVNQIVYEKDILQSLNKNISKVSLVLLCVAAVLLLISIVLINNTIRISVYSKRFVINTMKLVGAKAWFIRRPFIRRYLTNGLIAAVIALALLAAVVWYMQRGLDERINLFAPELWLPVGGLVVLLALGITFFAALFGVNRYLRMKTDDLYYI